MKPDVEAARLAVVAAAFWERYWPEQGRLDIAVRMSSRLVDRAGYYRPDQRLIMLSRPYADRYGEAELRATLLHELVHHAVQQRHGRAARPHGPEFIAEMRRVGCPRHCRDTSGLKRIVLQCAHCGRRYGRQRRLPRGGLACGPCCRRHAGGRFDRRFALVIVSDALGHRGGGAEQAAHHA